VTAWSSCFSGQALKKNAMSLYTPTLQRSTSTDLAFFKLSSYGHTQKQLAIASDPNFLWRHRMEASHGFFRGMFVLVLRCKMVVKSDIARTFWRLAGKHYRQTIENYSHSSGVANRRYIPDSRGRVGMATKETKGY
jgi:hypothetical protein